MKGLPIGAENLSAWRSRATLRAAQWGMGTVEVNFVSGHRAASGENGEKGFFWFVSFYGWSDNSVLCADRSDSEWSQKLIFFLVEEGIIPEERSLGGRGEWDAEFEQRSMAVASLY